MNKYAYRLKELRKPINEPENHMTMEKLCDIFRNKYNLKVNKSMISRWENGSAIPDNKHILAYAKYFNIDMNYLYGLTDVKQTLNNSIHNDILYETDKFAKKFEEIKTLDLETKEVIFNILEKLLTFDKEKLKGLNLVI